MAVVACTLRKDGEKKKSLLCPKDRGCWRGYNGLIAGGVFSDGEEDCVMLKVEALWVRVRRLYLRLSLSLLKIK